jgi:hypothetical protein
LRFPGGLFNLNKTQSLICFANSAVEEEAHPNFSEIAALPCLLLISGLGTVSVAIYLTIAQYISLRKHKSLDVRNITPASD